MKGETKESPASQLKALGDPTRWEIVMLLACCPADLGLDESGGVRRLEGPTAGQVCCTLTGGDKINSTISHHLKELREAGLIQMERRGKHMVCCLDRPALKKLAKTIESIAEGENNGCC